MGHDSAIKETAPDSVNVPQNEHTPGPWAWYWRTNDEGESDCGVFHESRPGHAYSVCRCPRYQERSKWEPDARLIAEAPALLEILQIIIANARMQPDASMNGATDIYAVPLDDIEAARAAIAKATGASC